MRMLHVVDAEHCSLSDVELNSDWSEVDDLDVGTASAESLIGKTRQDNRREPEIRIVAVVGRHDFIAALVPVAPGHRFTHMSGHAFGCS